MRARQLQHPRGSQWVVESKCGWTRGLTWRSDEKCHLAGMRGAYPRSNEGCVDTWDSWADTGGDCLHSSNHCETPVVRRGIWVG